MKAILYRVLLAIALALGLAMTGCANVLEGVGEPILDETGKTAQTIQRGIEAANKQTKDILDRRLDREGKNRQYADELQRRLQENDRRTVNQYVERACKLAPGIEVRLPITAAVVVARCPEPPGNAAEAQDAFIAE